MQTSALRGSGEASTPRLSDRDLIARFLASRDESAFAEIVARYSRLVMSVAVHTLRDPHAAEDAFQAAFLVLAKNARRIRNRDSLASWLHGTTYRVSHRLLRSRLRRKEQDLPSVELPSPIWADPQRPDEQAALDEELSRLSEGLRGPLVLHYLEGRTVPEIAAELKMSQSAVEGRLKRGKKTLRKRLLKRGVLLSSAAFGAGLTVPAEAGVAGALVTATVAACLKTAATTSLAPVAASTIQQIALQETAAMTRIALLKMALVCGGVAGAIGLAGAGANGTLGMAWANPGEAAAVAQSSSSQFEATELPMPATGVIQTALAQAAGEPNVVAKSDAGVLTADRLEIDVRESGAIKEELLTELNAIRERANAALQKKIQVSAAGESLATFLKQLSKELDVPIHIQEGAIDPFFSGVHFVGSGLTFKDVLSTVLKDKGLDYQVQEDGIHVRRNPPSERSRMQRVLEQQTALRFDGAPLRDVFEVIERRTKGKVHLDQDAAYKLNLDSPVTSAVSGSIGSALEAALGQLPGGPYSVRAEADGIHIAAVPETSALDPEASAPREARPGTGSLGALTIAKQAEAKEQQIQALENMVRQLQVQVEQLREDQRRAKEGVPLPGTYDIHNGGIAPGALPGNEPGGEFGVRGTVGLGAPAALPAPGMAPYGDAPINGPSAGIAMPGAAGMPSGMAEMMQGFATAAPQRPKAVDELLKSADKQRAKALRDYLSQLEANARRGNDFRRPNTPPSADIQEFRPPNPAEDRIRQSLEKPVDFQFTGQSLQEVMNFLAQQENITIRIDHTALTNAGVGPDQEINLVISGISLRSAMKLMLEDVGGTALDYVIEDDVMKVTTKEKADQTMQTVVYDISALGSIDPTQLEMIIERTVEPASWEGAGGKGAIVPVDGSLVITTSRRLHDKVGEILKMLQQHAKARKTNQ